MTKVVIIASAGACLASTVKEIVANIGISEIDVEIIDEKNSQYDASQLSKELILCELDYSEKLFKKQSYQQQQKDLRFMNKRKKRQ